MSQLSEIHDKEKQVAESEEMLQVKIPHGQGPSSLSMELLPSPSTAQAPKATPTSQKYQISTAVVIPIWIVLSSSVIIYNNYLYNTLNFKYPVFLVTWHLTFAAIGTRVLQRTTNLLDGVKDVHMTKDMFVRSILPIGVLFSGSLILSNTAYLYLSVSYIQMLKVRFMHFFARRSDKNLHADVMAIIAGLHPCRNSPHFMDFPLARA